MKKMMGLTKFLVCSAAMIVLCIGCQTIKYQPDSAIPESQVVVADDIEAHYVKSSSLDYSVGMKPLSSEGIGILLFLHNKSDELIHFDPAQIRCTGLTKDGISIDIPIWDPDKYIAGQKALAGFAFVFGDPFTYSKAQTQISDLSRQLLKKQDILPSQQCQGLVVVKRVYKEVKDSSGRTEKVEQIIDHYELTLYFFGESFVVGFRRTVGKT